MRKISTIVIATAAALCGFVIPASADWDRIGAVQVSPGRDQDRVHGSFGGPIERLRLDADNADVFCRSVRVTFANGKTRNVFSGRLDDRRPRAIDLPGDQRNVRRIDLRCRSLARRSAQIVIAAEIGRYREAWRQSPDWNRLWARVFPWAENSRSRGWVHLGRERFVGALDRETVFNNFRGRNLRAIGIQAVDNDARCTNIRVHFANGRSRLVGVDWGDRLQEDHIYRFDLPGSQRNVQRIEMACRAVGDRDVTMNIYGVT